MILMPGNEKAALAGAALSKQQQNQQPENSTPATPRKWSRVLAALLTGRSFNRFEATRELRDWCLHSTVSSLERKGVKIDRRDEVVPGFEGHPTHVTRYWLASDSYDLAAKLLCKSDAEGA